jgi:hypothetical protein
MASKITIFGTGPHNLIQPMGFYRWQTELFERGGGFVERHFPAQQGWPERKIAVLETKPRQQDQVLVELMAKHVVPKTFQG